LFIFGTSPSGKALVFGTGIQRFESFCSISADIAQMVEYQVVALNVTGSNPVVRLLYWLNSIIGNALNCKFNDEGSSPFLTLFFFQEMAQFGSVSVLGTECQGFKSLFPV
jgi:hypothetical protein